MNLEALATAVKSNFKTLQESEIIGRIMILSGRNIKRSITGYEMLVAQKMLPDGFIEPESRGIIFRMIKKFPTTLELMERLDMIPGKTIKTQSKTQKIAELTIMFEEPKRLTAEEILARFKFSDLDF
jgi:hypothetical protein